MNSLASDHPPVASWVSDATGLAGGEDIEVHMVYPKGGILWNDGT